MSYIFWSIVSLYGLPSFSMLRNDLTVTVASPLISTLPGATFLPGSSGKLGPTSRYPRIRGDSDCQSWTVEVPSMRILLPERASSRVNGPVGANAAGAAAAGALAAIDLDDLSPQPIINTAMLPTRRLHVLNFVFIN